MKVICISDTFNDLPKKLRKYAFTQDDDGKVDLTPNEIYEVYGIKKYLNQKFYLVLTDKLSHHLPWWMPEQFFKVVDAQIPKTWIKKKNGEEAPFEEILAPPSYHNNEDAIEDGEPEGYQAFERMREESSYSG